MHAGAAGLTEQVLLRLIGIKLPDELLPDIFCRSDYFNFDPGSRLVQNPDKLYSMFRLIVFGAFHHSTTKTANQAGYCGYSPPNKYATEIPITEFFISISTSSASVPRFASPTPY